MNAPVALVVAGIAAGACTASGLTPVVTPFPGPAGRPVVWTVATRGRASMVVDGAPPQGDRRSDWIEPGEGRRLAAELTFPNADGRVGVLLAGPVETARHPFFTAIGENGRACVTCHQPAHGMTVSAAAIAERWRLTQGRDPIFEAIDGSNSPTLPRDREASHSLLITRGLFRVGLPWPPRPIAGRPVTPELPVFKVTCQPSAPPHPYLGRVIYTLDPGRALITGRCNDVGSIVMQQLRGLAARAPYFANGGARTLGELVDFYDRRFDMKLSEPEKQDLVNFLSVL